MTSAPPSSKAAPLPIDFQRLRETLRRGDATRDWYAAWLEATHAAPERFWAAAYEHMAKRSSPIKDGTATVFDFYQDAVAVHAGRGRHALIAEGEFGDVSVSYADLNDGAGGLGAAWREMGVGPGSCIALLSQLGPDYLVQLVTSLGLGAVVCPLPVQGGRITRARMDALKPDYVVGSERQLKDLGEGPWQALPARARPDPSGLRGHGYAAADPVLRLFPVYGEEIDTPIELTAAVLHGAILRDGLCTLALEASDTVAAPGFAQHVFQPTLLLSVLLFGARWSEWSPKNGQLDPALIERHAVTVLGVRQSLREQLLDKKQWPGRTVRLWLRLLTDKLDSQRWEELAACASRANVAYCNWAYSTAAGGALLAGPPQRGILGFDALPGAGQTWQLDEPGARELPALSEYAQYVPTIEGKPAPGVPRLIVNRQQRVWQCTGSLDLGPDAMTYPTAAVIAHAELDPLVAHASVVLTPSAQINRCSIALLVFTHPLLDEARAREIPARVCRSLRAEFGADFEPTRVEVYPLRPRMSEDGIDHEWCRSQFKGGALNVKSKSEVFKALSRLASMLLPEEYAAKGGSEWVR
jgi:hypothetical protein